MLSQSNIYYDDEGNPKKIIGVKQNITERKEAELRITRLNDLNKKKNQVLGMVAHDLRTPLSNIVGLADLLRTEIEEEQQETFNHIIDACNTANDIISSLLELAKAQNNFEELERSRIDFNQMVKQSINRLRFKLEEKNQVIKTNLSEEAQVIVDEKKFSRVIDNLLTNAIKFTPKNGIIKVSTIRNDGFLLLKVEDSGIGIKQEDIPSLFDENIKTIRRKGTEGELSTGLGLMIVKQIVDMHGAELSVQSEVNKGTEFTVKLNIQEGSSNVDMLTQST